MDLYDALSSDPDCAKRVHSLTLRTNITSQLNPLFGLLNRTRHEGEQKPMVLVFEAILGLTDHLSSMVIEDVQCGDSDTPLASYLSRTKLPFNLVTFGTNVPLRSIIPFLDSQPGIKTYQSFQKLPCVSSFSLPLLTPNTLPSLESITSTFDDIFYLVPGRPVRNIHITDHIILSFAPSLRTVILASTASVIHLELPAGAGDLAIIIPMLADALPRLRWLGGYANSASTLVPVLQAFPELHTLKLWEGGSGTPRSKLEFFQVTRRHPLIALRQIEFWEHIKKDERSESMVVSCESEFAAWRVQSGCTQGLKSLIEYITVPQTVPARTEPSLMSFNV